MYLEDSDIGQILFKVRKYQHYNISYRNDPKFSDRQVRANSADPVQTAPRGAV